MFAVLRAKNESPGDQKIAARVFSTSRFTPNKTRVYETKKNRTMTQCNENPGQTVQEVIVVFFSWIQKDKLVHFIFYTLCVRMKALQLGF